MLLLDDDMQSHRIQSEQARQPPASCQYAVSAVMKNARHNHTIIWSREGMSEIRDPVLKQATSAGAPKPNVQNPCQICTPSQPAQVLRPRLLFSHNFEIFIGLVVLLLAGLSRRVCCDAWSWSRFSEVHAQQTKAEFCNYPDRGRAWQHCIQSLRRSCY